LEIDAGQLRFSLEETREYITSRRQISLDAADINKLFQKTEGWVAGLWLASAAMASHQSKAEFVGRFSGSNLEVADYLGEDVLNQQTPEVRTFLLHTSVLRTLSPDLCKALVPEVDSEGLLKSLEADNVLITRIAGEERSYRYHSLFADYLKSRLLREQPGLTHTNVLYQR
jgi:LuxR family maltose regulon positive regulatory protein